MDTDYLIPDSSQRSLTVNKNVAISTIVLLGIFIYGTRIPLLSISLPIILLPLLFFLKHRRLDLAFFLDLSFVLLFAFLYYFVGNYIYEFDDFGYATVLKIANVGVLYCMGILIGQNYRAVEKTTFFVVGGMVLLAILTALSYLAGEQTLYIESREVPYFWPPHDMVMAPTIGVALALGMCMATAIFAKGRPMRMVMLGVAAIAFFTNLALINRSPIYAMILAVGIAAVTYGVKHIGKRKVFFILLACGIILLLLIGVGYLFSENDFAEVPAFARIMDEGIESPRYEIWYLALTGLVDNPWGGKLTYLAGFPFAHNLWLDIGWSVGFIPMLLMLAFQIRHAKYVLRIISDGVNPYIIIGTVTAYMISMFVEPVMEGMPEYVAISVFLLGYVKSYVTSSDEEFSGRTV